LFLIFLGAFPVQTEAFFDDLPLLPKAVAGIDSSAHGYKHYD
jgi:hypothetical protein